MCFLFPLGAVLMRGNAGALTERHNEVRSTGKATVIRDGLDALRGGEQLLLCGAQTHGLQKLMRCNGSCEKTEGSEIFRVGDHCCDMFYGCIQQGEGIQSVGCIFHAACA